MDFSAVNPIVFFATMLAASMPILFAAIGELVVERSGVLNLGVEGLMIIGAVCGFIIAVESGSAVLGALGASVAGAGASLLFACLTQYLYANQVATGLALTLFGLGVSALLGQKYAGIRPPEFPTPDFGSIADLPVIGALLFSHDFLIYLALVLVVSVWWFLNHSRAGLVLRSLGDNHDAAHSLGYKVKRIRLLAILFGGACGGMGGAYLALIRVPQWTEGATAGAGWIALALVIFGSWHPFRVALGALLFGGVTLLQFNFQAMGLAVNPAYLSMAPYVMTILALLAISYYGRGRTSLNLPRCLGKPFRDVN